MSFFHRPGREEMAAGLAAVVLLSVAALFWLRHDGSIEPVAETIAPPALDDELPVDPDLQTGTLPNGLRYFIRANNAPKQRAELRLVVSAGSVLERDDQRGLAHAVEHMLFRGTRHFPRRAVDNYMQSIGMRAGEDINARTTDDETVYRITVPTERAGALDTAIAMLADMAHDATFDPMEARTEAGVVFEEWRSGRGARARLREQRNALLLAGSRYSGHPTIGDTAVLRKFDVGAMRRFYSDWYRPELMAVAAVGDFDPLTVQRLVKTHFGVIPTSTDPRERPAVPVRRTREPRAATMTDPEAIGTRVSLWFPHQTVPRRRVENYRTELIQELWRDVLNARLEVATEQAGSPLLTASVSGQWPVRPLQAEAVSALVVDGSVPMAIDLLVSELARLARPGPTAREVKLRADAMLKQRRLATEWQDVSDDIVEGYVEAFLSGDPAMTHDAEYELAQRIIPTIRPVDLAVAARRASIDRGAIVLVTAPDRSALAQNTPETLIEQARVASTRASDRQATPVDSVKLLPNPPAPGQIASEQMLLKLDAVDWTLSNGMRVILKPTKFTHDDIQFRMLGAGGASLASDADFPSAFFSDGVIRSTGVGPVNGARLGRLLDASSIDLTQSVGDDAIELTGNLDPRDLEMLFQVLNLHFTQPRADTVAFRRYRERALSFTAHRGADPDAVFFDTVAVTTAQHHRRSLRNGAAVMRAVSLTRAIAFWKARMSNAASFTLVMTGDFALPQVRPLVTRYLASLPKGVSEQSRDNGIRFPSGVVERKIYVGTGPRAKTQIVLSGPFDHTPEAHEALGVARDVAERALGDQLRETLGGTYGVNVSSGVSLVTPAMYTMTIEFEASPDRIDSLANAALAELQRLRTRGPTRQEVEKTREAETRDLDDKLDDNSYWADELMWHARMGWPFAGILTHQERAKKLSTKTLRDACAKYLDASRYARVTMYPKRITTP